MSKTVGTGSFDAEAYKAATRRQWDDAAGGWHDWAAMRERWLAGATERMLDLAGIGPGSSVLDVAAGDGGQTLIAARRVGAAGSVLATDIAPEILALAAREARAAGLENVATRVVDGERLDVAPGSFDAAICRLGVMFFPDCEGALRGVRRALRPGGRAAVVVFSTPDRNGFFAQPLGIARRAAGLGPPAPGEPGPFSLGEPGRLEAAMRSAGFGDVQVDVVPAPLRLGSAAECVRMQQESFGVLRELLGRVGEDARREAWAEIGRALERYDGPGGFSGDCELLVAGGTA
ncbi:MAG TPA: methyltransferase domain-containing protein [Solirubrobacteraceae bacterium]|nr:methyltransferase domain-containing protein [Solirubrobacteraceae bacterium]